MASTTHALDSRSPLPAALRQFLRTPKGTLAAIFVVLFALGATAVGWPLAVSHLLAAITGAVATELVVDRYEHRLHGWPSSALLSGAIVGFVLSPDTTVLVTLAVGVLATLVKHLFATDRWHVFNPAGLALLLGAMFLGTGQSWWGGLPDLSWPFVVVLLTLGAVLVDRINKFPLVLSFLGALFGLFVVLGHVQPAMAAELFRPPFLQATLFLALFMLTDPPTAPARNQDQVWIGLLAGAASAAAYLLGAGQMYLLVGLLAGNVALAARRVLVERRTGAARSPSRGAALAQAIRPS